MNELWRNVPEVEQAECRELVEWATAHGFTSLGFWTGDDARVEDLVGNRPTLPVREYDTVACDSGFCFIKREKMLWDRLHDKVADYWSWTVTPNEKLGGRSPYEALGLGFTIDEMNNLCERLGM